MTTTIAQWSRFTGALTHPTIPADPYGDVQLQIEATDPHGQPHTFAGFYDGGATWGFRLLATIPGSWHFCARFNDGSAAATGQFDVTPSDASGLLTADPADPFWFGSANGHRQLLRGLHVGDRFFAANWEADSRSAFLDWCQEQGYNLLSVASHYLNRNQEDRGRGWDTPRLWPLDPGQYHRLEAILDDLARRRILVFPFAGFFGQDSHYPTDPTDQETYIRYTLARLGAYPNLLFNVAGPEPNLGQSWMSEADVIRLGRLIASHAPYPHLISVHNRTGPDPYRDADWTTYGVLQGPKTVNRAELAAGLLASHHAAKPLLAQETLWSGNVNHLSRLDRDYTDTELRRNALAIHLSGAALVFADNRGKSSSGFSGTMDLADCRQDRHDILRRVWDLCQVLPYHQLRPRSQVVEGGIALGDDHRLLVYVETPAQLTLPSGPWEGTWIDPRQPLDRTPCGAVQSGPLQPPTNDDWLLYLRRTGPEVPDQIHLSWSGDPATTLSLTWHTADAAPTWAQYRRVDQPDWRRAEGISFPAPGKGHLHRVDLTGLEPGTAYEYRPTAGPRLRSRTAPPPGPAAFTCAFVANTGLIGRPDGNATGTRQILDELLRDDPLFVLGGGDYAYANRDGRCAETGAAVDDWFAQSKELLGRTPFMAHDGNHEIHLQERYENWTPRFAHPPGFDQGCNYSFEVGEVHFTALFVPGEDLTPAQLDWLEQDLAAGRRRRWLVVFQHESIYGHGSSHPAQPKIRAALAPLFEKHRVDLHLSAHDQNYERTFPLTGVPAALVAGSDHLHRYRQGQGVVYAKVSPGGKMSEVGDQFSRLPAEAPPFIAVRHDRAHHYALLQVGVDGTLSLDVFNVVGDGTPKTLLDTFTLQSAS
ncbi:MAG: DUF5060 domain-containing protein [Candidatus Latescibacteria bacterium]|nr:DUF5060 domain-containing protein [Candidatus Latescibacterota bacterium]